MDDQLVFNKYECGFRELCEHTVADVTVTPGVHRITIGAFQENGEWGLSLRLEQDGNPIVDDPTGSPDWVFHGTDRPVGSFPCSFDPVEDCDNGLDDDGDEQVDCADTDCVDIFPCVPETCDNDVDDDGNDLIDCADPDCAEKFFCEEEICDNGLDDDGDVDCDDVECR